MSKLEGYNAYPFFTDNESWFFDKESEKPGSDKFRHGEASPVKHKNAAGEMIVTDGYIDKRGIF